MFKVRSDRARALKECGTYTFVRQSLAGFLVLLLVSQSAQSAFAQQASPAPQQAPASAKELQPTPLPDSPSVASAEPQSIEQNQASSSEPQVGSSKPVGTAAAPYMKPTGTAASRPAGAAIAPGKQRRVHSFVIKFGLIAGAAVAGGVVVALSAGSRSRP